MGPMEKWGQIPGHIFFTHEKLGANSWKYFHPHPQVSRVNETVNLTWGTWGWGWKCWPLAWATCPGSFVLVHLSWELRCLKTLPVQPQRGDHYSPGSLVLD